MLKCIRDWNNSRPKGKFVTKLIVQFRDKGTQADLYNDLVYYTSAKERICVPINTYTDFASIPRIFWNIFPPTGTYAIAAVIHDYLYEQQGIEKYSRKDCDNIFLEAMHANGVSITARYIMYWMVRLFGKWAWWSAGRELKKKLETGEQK